MRGEKNASFSTSRIWNELTFMHIFKMIICTSKKNEIIILASICTTESLLVIANDSYDAYLCHCFNVCTVMMYKFVSIN